MCRNFRRPTGQVRVGLPWDSKPATKRGRQPRRERKRAKAASPLFSSETVSPALRESRDADKMETGTGSELFRSAFNPSNTPPPAFNPSQAFNPSSSSAQNFFVPSSSFGSSGQFFSSPGNRGQRQFVDQVIFANLLGVKGSAFFEPAILG